jgi:hypothetical protein
VPVYLLFLALNLCLQRFIDRAFAGLAVSMMGFNGVVLFQQQLVEGAKALSCYEPTWSSCAVMSNKPSAVGNGATLSRTGPFVLGQHPW